MTRSLRNAWRAHITACDYDAHMAAVGQAQANARLIERFVERWLKRPARVVVAGAGTGQMFDYARADLFDEIDVTFTDLSPGLLARLSERLGASRAARTTILVDDIENTALTGPFDAAIVVLVLEHINWRRGVASLAKLEAARCLVVIQQNPGSPISRTLPGSLAVLHEVAWSLLDPGELQREFAHHGYDLLAEEPADVPDGKTMLAHVFGRRPSQDAPFEVSVL